MKTIFFILLIFCCSNSLWAQVQSETQKSTLKYENKKIIDSRGVILTNDGVRSYMVAVPEALNVYNLGVQRRTTGVQTFRKAP